MRFHFLSRYVCSSLIIFHSQSMTPHLNTHTLGCAGASKAMSGMQRPVVQNGQQLIGSTFNSKSIIYCRKLQIRESFKDSLQLELHHNVICMLAHSKLSLTLFHVYRKPYQGRVYDSYVFLCSLCSFIPQLFK